MEKQEKITITKAIILTALITAIITIVLVFAYNKIFKKEDSAHIEDNNPIKETNINKEDILKEESSKEQSTDTNKEEIDSNIKYIYISLGRKPSSL